MQVIKLSSVVSGVDFDSDQLVYDLPEGCLLDIDLELSEEKLKDLEEAIALSPFEISTTKVIPGMNKDLMVHYINGGIINVTSTLTASTENSSVGTFESSVSTYVEGSIGYELYKNFIA